MLKKLLYIVGAAVVLVGIGIVLLLWNINPVIEKFRPTILSSLSEALKQQVTIGTVSASVFPRATVEIADVRVGEHAAVVDVLKIRTSVSSMLRGVLNVQELVLERPKIQLKRTQNGDLFLGKLQLNETADGNKQPPATKAEHTPASETAGEPEKEKVSLLIERIQVDDGELKFIDESVHPSQTIDLRDLDTALSDIDPKGRARVTASMNGFGVDNTKFSIIGVIGNVNAGEPLDLTVEADRLDLGKVAALAANYKLTKEKISAEHHGAIKITVKTVDDKTLKISSKLDLKEAALRIPGQLSKPSGVTFSWNGNVLLHAATGNKYNLTGVDGDLTLGSSTVQLSLAGKQDTDLTEVKVTSAGISLAELGAILPATGTSRLSGKIVPDLALTFPMNAQDRVAAMTTAGKITLIDLGAVLALKTDAEPLLFEKGSGEVRFQGKAIQASQLSGTLGGQPIIANLKLPDLSKKSLSFEVTSPRFGLEGVGRALASEPLKNGYLSGLRLVGSCNFDTKECSIESSGSESNIGGVPSTGFSFKANQTANRTSLKDGNFSLFGGTVTAAGSLSGPEKNRFATVITATQLNLDNLFAVAAPQSSVSLTGPLSTFRAELSGDTQNASGTLTGPFNLVAGPGTIRGVNILKQTLGKIDSIPGVSGALLSFVPEQFRGVVNTEDSAYDQLTVNAQAENGKINLNSLELKHSLYAVTGSGWLQGDEMEIKAQFRLAEVFAQGMIGKNAALKFLMDRSKVLVIPILITRRDGHTIVLPDVTDLLKRVTTGAVTDVASKALEKVKPGLGNAGKLLEGFLHGK